MTARLLRQGKTAWDTVMAPQQARVSADGFADGISQDVVVDTDIGEQARRSAPVVWLVGKVQAGKSSIVKALTGSNDAQIGRGFKACTTTAHLFDFPANAPVIRFLDTRGLGETGYDPADDIAFCEGQAHLLLVVMKAMDQQQQSVVNVVTAVRQLHGEWPVVVAQTNLHEGYGERPAAEQLRHPQPYPFGTSIRDSPNVAAGCTGLARALAHQRAMFDGVPGRGPILFVPVDFTLADDGFTPQLYGLDALRTALGEAAPLGLAAWLAGSAALASDELASRAHPHVMGYATAAAAVDTLPVAGLVAVPGVQAKMLHSLARIYGVEWDRRMWIEFSSCLGSGVMLRLMVGLGIREAIKLLPAYGQSVATASAAATSFATTTALGKAACYFLQQRLSGRTDRDGVAAAYQQALKDAFAMATSDKDKN